MKSWRAAATLTLLAFTYGLVSRASAVQQASLTSAVSPWASWIEPDFPFFSSVLDAGRAGPEFPARNLTPRGLILNLGRGHWVAFDTDLLRVAAVWRGNAVTPKALAPGSYHEADKKTQGGQSPPEPDGKVWVANGIYPGWQNGARPSLDDPREPAPSVEEVGRGPVSDAIGRFKAIRLVRGGAVLEYTVRGAEVREWMTVAESNGRSAIVRNIDVGPVAEPLWLMLGFRTKDGSMSVCHGTGAAPVLEPIAASGEPMWAVKVAPHAEPIQFCVAMADGPATDNVAFQAIPTAAPSRRWPQEVTDDGHPVDREGRVRRGRLRAAGRESLAPQRAPRRYSVPQGRHGRQRHPRRRRVDRPRPASSRAGPSHGSDSRRACTSR